MWGKVEVIFNEVWNEPDSAYSSCRARLDIQHLNRGAKRGLHSPRMEADTYRLVRVGKGRTNLQWDVGKVEEIFSEMWNEPDSVYSSCNGRLDIQLLSRGAKRGLHSPRMETDTYRLVRVGKGRTNLQWDVGKGRRNLQWGVEWTWFCLLKLQGQTWHSTSQQGSKEGFALANKSNVPHANVNQNHTKFIKKQK